MIQIIREADKGIGAQDGECELLGRVTAMIHGSGHSEEFDYWPCYGLCFTFETDVRTNGC